MQAANSSQLPLSTQLNQYIAAFQIANRPRDEKQTTAYLTDTVTVTKRPEEGASLDKIVSFMTRFFEEVLVTIEPGVSSDQLMRFIQQFAPYCLKEPSNLPASSQLELNYLRRILIPAVDSRISKLQSDSGETLLSVYTYKESLEAAKHPAAKCIDPELDSLVCLRDLLFMQSKLLKIFFQQAYLTCEMSTCEEEMVRHNATVRPINKTFCTVFSIPTDLSLTAEEFCIILKASKPVRDKFSKTHARQFQDLLELVKRRPELDDIAKYIYFVRRHEELVRRLEVYFQKYLQAVSICTKIFSLNKLKASDESRLKRQHIWIVSSVEITSIYNDIRDPSSHFTEQQYTAHPELLKHVHALQFQKESLIHRHCQGLLEAFRRNEPEQLLLYETTNAKIREKISALRAQKLKLGKYLHSVEYIIASIPKDDQKVKLEIKEWKNSSLETLKSRLQKIALISGQTTLTQIDELKASIESKPAPVEVEAPLAQEPPAPAATASTPQQSKKSKKRANALPAEPSKATVEAVEVTEKLQTLTIRAPRTPFPLHSRVIRWYKPENFPFGDPNYSSAYSPQARSWIVAEHNFAKVIDHLAFSEGIRKDNQICFVGTMTMNGETRKGLFTYAFNEQGVCYHRYFTTKTVDQLFNEYAQKGFYDLDFPSLQSLLTKEKGEDLAVTDTPDDASFIESTSPHVITIQDPKNSATIKLCRL